MTPNNTPGSPGQIDRRNVLKGSVATSLALMAGSSVTASRANGDDSERDPTLIQRENDQPGSKDWQLTRVRLDSNKFRSPWIEGYCSKQSVAAGESIDIMVSTDPVQDFKIEIFRTGFYGGRGARLMKTVGPFKGRRQPVPPIGKKNLLQCRWQPCVSLTIPEDWTSQLATAAKRP